MCAGGFLQHCLNLSVSAVCDRESLSEETKEAKEKLCKVFLEFVIATFASDRDSLSHTALILRLR